MDNIAAALANLQAHVSRGNECGEARDPGNLTTKCDFSDRACALPNNAPTIHVQGEDPRNPLFL
jgi:hypothetical protein